jgi:hypothetical protein
MNQLYYGDNMQVLREHIVDKSVDRIYFDLKIAQSFSSGFATQQIKKQCSAEGIGSLEKCLVSYDMRLFKGQYKRNYKI